MPTQATVLGGSEKQTKKKVFYEGSDALKEGYALCYNRDYGTAAAEDMNRASRVEKPAAGNISWFAGVVSQGYDGVTGPCTVEIIEPTGAMARVFSSASAVIGTTALYVQAGSYVIGSVGGLRVGTAYQTVDRSSTNGPVQALLFKPTGEQNSAIAANSRTAVMLPTAAIWDNFDLQAARMNPYLASMLDTDFKQGCPWFNSYVSATYAASAEGKSITEYISIGNDVTAIGSLKLFTTTDNQAAELQFPVPILIPTILAPATKWGFEVRLKHSVVTTAKAGWFAGLMIPQALAGVAIADDDSLQANGSIGFQKKAGDAGTGVIDYVYDNTGQAQNEYAASLKVLAADTFVTLGMYYNGTTIASYVDGVAAGTAIPNANLDDADFPGGIVMVPTLALKAAHADDYTVTVDWLRVAQQ